MSMTKGFATFELNSCFQDEKWLNNYSKNPYYGIIWSGNHHMMHVLNGKEVIVPKNHFLFVPPNSVQKFIQKEKMSAHYIVFKQEFYSKSIEDRLKLENCPLFSMDKITVVKNAICSAPLFVRHFLHFFEYDLSVEINLKLVHNLLERIVLNGQFEIKMENTQFIKDDYDIELATKFKKLLQQNVNEYIQVSFYVDLLYVTKRRLDKATLIVYRKTAKEMIIDELVKNAKILLINSKMSIKEISIELNFLQETNFTAFFKKQMGISPSKFRQNAPS